MPITAFALSFSIFSFSSTLALAKFDFDVPTEVNISNDLSNLRTIIEIRALDHPGLLATVGNIFSDFGIMIENAKITTLGECAEDIFFVVDINRNPLSDAKLCEQLRTTLKTKIDQKLAECFITYFGHIWCIISK